MTITAPPMPATTSVARVEADVSVVSPVQRADSGSVTVPPKTPQSAGHGMDEALADMDAAVALMLRVSAGVDVDAAVSWPAEGRQRMLRLLDRVVDGFTTQRGAVLVAEGRAGTWRGAGDRSLEAWRVRHGGASARSAAAQVRQAEQLAAAPEAAAAVTGGSIGVEHAAAIARVAAGGSPAQQAALAAGGTEVLLGWAQEQDAGTFTTTVARWAAEQDPDRLEADHQAQRRERYLSLATTPRGTVLRGLLDVMAGHRLTLALEAVTARPAADDDRSPGQRSADALDTMAQRILSSADTKPGAHVPPHVSLILPAATFAATRAHRDRRRAAAAAAASAPAGAGPGMPADGMSSGSGDSAAGTAVVPSYPPVTWEDGTPVPVSEVALVLCDCAVTRVGVDASGIPMDLGRTQRLFSGEQRRAIIARDRECIWPGCRMKARWCEIHHRIWWERDNGTTCVDDGVLMCGFHHHETHRQDLTIIRILGMPDGPPGHRRRPRAEISPIAYQFRDPAGRLVDASTTTTPPGAAATPAIPATNPTLITAASPHPTPTLTTAPALTASETPDELDLGWTTDPFTGMRVPAFLLDR